MRNFILTLFCFSTAIVFAQVTPPTNCTSATIICDSIIVQDTLKVSVDYTADEISSNSCLPFGEICGTWYQFGVNDMGNLRFTITPFDTLTDFDWALYRIDWADCTNIFGVPSYEISCNASGIGGGFSTTGASGLLQQGHNAAINLTSPAVFYLYITTAIEDTDAVLGYTLDFSASDMELVACNEIGIEEEGYFNATVFPNPATDKVFVHGIHFIAEQFTVMDIAGKQVAVSPIGWKVEEGINVSNLPAGIYYYQLTDVIGKKLSGKLVVK